MTIFTPSVTIAARRTAVPGRAADLARWARQLAEAAAEFPGHQHGEVRRPRRSDVEVSLTFASMREAADWHSSERRKALLTEGAEFTDDTSSNSPAAGRTRRQLHTAVVVWLGLFPFALLLDLFGGVALDDLTVVVRTVVTTLVLVPLAVFVGIPVVHRMWARVAEATSQATAAWTWRRRVGRRG